MIEEDNSYPLAEAFAANELDALFQKEIEELKIKCRAMTLRIEIDEERLASEETKQALSQISLRDSSANELFGKWDDEENANFKKLINLYNFQELREVKGIVNRRPNPELVVKLFKHCKELSLDRRTTHQVGSVTSGLLHSL
jgi:hypothetical protein